MGEIKLPDMGNKFFPSLRRRCKSHGVPLAPVWFAWLHAEQPACAYCLAGWWAGGIQSCISAQWSINYNSQTITLQLFAASTFNSFLPFPRPKPLFLSQPARSFCSFGKIFWSCHVWRWLSNLHLKQSY